MNKKSNKKKQKKLKSLILLLFLTIVMLSTSTYAWFTANKTVAIADINVYVATSSGIQISTDAKNWKTMITNGDITLPTDYSANVNAIPDNMVPVSTAGSITSDTGYMNMYRGTVEADEESGTLALTAVTSPENTTDTRDFVSFDIFLKTEEDTTIYLENGSGVTVTTGKDDKGLEYAGRYAFLIEGNNSSTTADPAVVQAYHGATSALIFEPNYDGHTPSGIVQATNYYGITGLTATVVAGGDTHDNAAAAASSGNAAVTYSGVDDEIEDPIPLNETYSTDDPFGAITKTTLPYTYSTGDYTGNYTEAFELSAGITKIRVYMWIEGQDVDCENDASGSFITFALSLTTKTSATSTEPSEP